MKISPMTLGYLRIDASATDWTVTMKGIVIASPVIMRSEIFFGTQLFYNWITLSYLTLSLKLPRKSYKRFLEAPLSSDFCIA